MVVIVGTMIMKKLKALIGMKSVNSVSLRERGRDIYLSLIRGPASQTLGDGEASTIAYAVEIGGIAVIDDKKAEKNLSGKVPADFCSLLLLIC